MKLDGEPICFIVSFGVLGLLYGIYNIIAVDKKILSEGVHIVVGLYLEIIINFRHSW